jgi:hypothetical protein
MAKRERPCILFFVFLLSAVFIPSLLAAQNGGGDRFIDSLLRAHPVHFGKILKSVSKYEVQIIYTQVNRDKNNKPSLQHYTYRLGKSYFYPASLVKLPASALALEKLNKLNKEGVNKNTVMVTDSASQCKLPVREDSTASNRFPSVGHYIKRMLLVSDNFSYNRIYEFLGQEYTNERLWQLGYKDARVVHSFDGGCSDGKHTAPVSFYDSGNNLLYHQPGQANDNVYPHPRGNVKKGRAHLDSRDRMVRAPKDYTNMNYLPLADVHSMVIAIMMPEAVGKDGRFDLTTDDYTFLRRYMGMLPRESDFPKYDPKKFEDSHKKYLLYGTYHGTIGTDSIRIFNIVGQSYGDLSDCAYIADYKNNVEFFLSAVIYVNSDGVINDGKYEYKTIGFPFLTNLGKVFLDYERKRPRQYVPDLSEYKF